MGGILGKEGSPAKQRWGKLAKTITKSKEPEEQIQIHHSGQERQSFRYLFLQFFSAVCLHFFLIHLFTIFQVSCLRSD